MLAERQPAGTVDDPGPTRDARAVAPAGPAPGRCRDRHPARHAAPSRVTVLLPVLLLGVSGAAVGVLTLPAGNASGSATAAAGTSSAGTSGATALGPTARASAPATPTAGPLLNLSPGVDGELAFADAVAARSTDGGARTSGPAPVLSAAAAATPVVVPPPASTSPLARSRSEAPVLPAPLTTADGREILGSKAALLAAAAPSVVSPAVGPITSPFGYRWGRLHAGLDFGVPIGSPIVAVMDGVVLRTSSSRGGYGNLTVLQHADGTETRYAHQAQILVTDGQVIKVGELIGMSGNSGDSTGPHLHFEVRPGGGDPVDPRAWLAGQGVTV